jgi:hypothetical protein
MDGPIAEHAKRVDFRIDATDVCFEEETSGLCYQEPGRGTAYVCDDVLDEDRWRGDMYA